jgi:hypothetical protein
MLEKSVGWTRAGRKKVVAGNLSSFLPL